MKQFLLLTFIMLFIVLGACSALSSQLNGQLDGQIDPIIITYVAQTQTATAWTPTPVTPTATAVPNQVTIVNVLNDALRGADPLGEALDARFSVTDIGFDMSGNPSVTNKIRISIDCEWVYKSSCSVERTFVVLLHALKKDGIRKKINEQLPETIAILQIVAFDRMQPIGRMEILWRDLLSFAENEITGEQLAARATPIRP
jgi:hypothetical protein